MDCLEFMALLPDHSINAIITDLPYGTTACSWDTIIPFAPMWTAVKRILKPRGVFVTTASQPFTSLLVTSNLAWFKYEWVWDKVRPVGFLNAKIRPMMRHENILVFSEGSAVYCPQMTPMDKPTKRRSASSVSMTNNHINLRPIDGEYIENYPHSLLQYSNGANIEKAHPTQKPVALYEYLIRTYTQPGELVLDFTAGSGTTGVACVKTGRDYILVDSSQEYCDIAHKRINAGFVTVDVAKGIKQPSLFAELLGKPL